MTAVPKGPNDRPTPAVSEAGKMLNGRSDNAESTLFVQQTPTTSNTDNLGNSETSVPAANENHAATANMSGNTITAPTADPGPAPTASPNPSASAPQSSEHLTIRIKNQAGIELAFKLKQTTKLVKAMKAFAERAGGEGARSNDFRFLHDGDRLTGDETPESLGLEDDDQIDAFIEQTGGRGAETGMEC